jgi:hypothetical protein
MELFVLLKCRQGFLDRSSELGISGTEALKPALDWIINWFCGSQVSKDIGLAITHWNEPHRAALARE